jgi:hypothetical protein
MNRRELIDMNDLDRIITVEQVSGVEGPSLYIDSLRVAGNKPWGGGSYLGQWKTTPRAVFAALGGSASRQSLAGLDASETVPVQVRDGAVLIADRVLVTTPAEKSYPRNAKWNARRADIGASLAQSVRTAQLPITADIRNEVQLWHRQRLALTWAYALDQFFPRGT